MLLYFTLEWLRIRLNFLMKYLKTVNLQILREYLSNTGGLGKLLQALYNTPIEQRKKGIQRGLENTSAILELVSKEEATPERKDLIFWQNFSEYGLMQIFGGWFKHQQLVNYIKRANV